MGVRKVVAGLSAALLCCLAAGGASASPAPQASVSVHTVVAGLDNPRDLAFDRAGKLYVAEAGHGGSRCYPGPQGTACLGFTSGISRVNLLHQRARRIVSGLVSSAAQDGSGATGVDGIASRHGRIFGIITEAPQEVPGNAFGPNFTARVKAQLGELIKASTDGSWRSIASVGHRDYIWAGNHQNLVPGQFPDANPYGVTALRHGRYVVDAGSNTLDRIDRRGRVHILKFIPNPPSSDSVPTCIERGPDGALYIGELTGGGNSPGASSVWRYWRQTGSLTIWATGLTAVTGCGFHNGLFYATEFSTNGLDNAAPGTGAVVRVPPNSATPVTVVSGLNFPGGFAARGHNLYVSNWSILPATANGGGQVLRIHLGS
jgi:hypothetical protein